MHLSNIWIYSKIKYFWNVCKVFKLIIMIFTVFTKVIWINLEPYFKRYKLKTEKEKVLLKKKSEVRPKGPKPSRPILPHLFLPRAAAQHRPGAPSPQQSLSLSLSGGTPWSAPTPRPRHRHCAQITHPGRQLRPADSPPDSGHWRPLTSCLSTPIRSPLSPLSSAPKISPFPPPGC